jgi:hypothetical protein
VAAACTRGGGKSTLAVIKALHASLCERNHTTIFVSGKHAQSNYAGRMLRKFVVGTPLASEIVLSNDERTELRNGSVCYWSACSDPAVRGVHNAIAPRGQKIPKLLALCDESEVVPRRVYAALLGVLTASDENRLWCIGTGGSRSHWWEELWDRGHDPDSGVQAFRVTADELVGKVSYMSKRWHKQLKKQYSEHEARIELNAEFLDDG